MVSDRSLLQELALTLVQGAWAALLSRYSGELESPRLVGRYLLPIPLRVQVGGDDILTGLQTIQQRQQQNDQYAYTAA